MALKIKVKYFYKNLEKLNKISKGDWIDLRSAVDIHLAAGQTAFIPLGVGMILPEGYEAHIALAPVHLKTGESCRRTASVL